MAEGFPPERRIRRGSEFAAVLRRGRKRACRYFSLHVLPTGGKARLGIVASRRVGGAVERNRAKRLLREVFRRRASHLTEGADIVVVARSPIAEARLEDVERAFHDALREKGRS